ncbi:hypothetical protein AOA14_15920 [Sphingopyxis terrae subsp. terrae NBRC 15098]|uniref:Uncharacterized protein n=1 Tax=Sphingopyxis terrae subsp. terrae NBRC 15098 TaxID=1219058 RepID=A0A142W230_9SPHN|nr:hypothetical protein [Sphingopyxis terrae]AMU96094.1 hypothetical protein AOA14_15920 [Sphingopyxis terrae subsp. terrae NBRC 15098]
MKTPKILLAGLAFFLVPTTADVEAEERAACAYDRNAILQLDPNMFDQDDKAGWRELANRDGCQAAAADAIALYIESHRETLVRQWQLPSFKWHEAQLRAMAGQVSQATRLMRQSIKPEKGPEGFEGWTDYALPWNQYVLATIAFLEGDMDALKEARDRLANSPMPPGFDTLDRSQVSVPPSWPLNLDVVDGLIACIGQPYQEAYGSAHCRDVGKQEARRKH